MVGIDGSVDLRGETMGAGVWSRSVAFLSSPCGGQAAIGRAGGEGLGCTGRRRCPACQWPTDDDGSCSTQGGSDVNDRAGVAELIGTGEVERVFGSLASC
jgi:hypothetical protein